MEMMLSLLAALLVVGGMAIWRIGRVVSWRALLMTARATGSLAECVAFLRFCRRHSGAQDQEMGVARWWMF